MFQPAVTIITSVYSSSDEFLRRQVRAIKSQKYKGKIIHILVNDNVKRKISVHGARCVNHTKNKGLVATLNEGFKVAKTSIVVSLMDDCMPSSNDWLAKLVAPLEDEGVAATASSVEMPKRFFDSFSYFTKAITEKEQRVIVPGLDEKGCAYRVSALKEFGYLDEKSFKNGGEDTDLTLKIERSRWKIVKTGAKVFHYHHFTFKSRLKKESQYARLAGLVSRKHFLSMPWNFKAQVGARIFTFLFLLYSIAAGNMVFLSSALVLLVSNMRLPFQVKRLGNDVRIIAVPLLNIYLYILYTFNYVYALLLNPTT